ncbi:MAG: hypothetical protein LBC87_06485 [Fibromonadaceae bacterium]|jgi:C-terminal peptidase prc|nr:hypothetical protein [Fibromonadaceae bacterium]
MRIVLLFCGLLIFACGHVGSEISGDDDQELYQNYLLLKAYFFHPERIKEYEEYRSMKIDSIYKKVDSMYKSLDDYFCGAHYVGDIRDCQKYTRYYPPEKTNDKINEIEKTERYYSFGFLRDGNKSGDTMIVWWVYPISPAATAGLRKKDRLLSANGISLTGLDLAGKDSIYLENDDPFKDSTVFVVLREGKTITLPAMKKKEVPEPTVYLDSLDGIPYIRVYQYKLSTNNPRGTYYEFYNILQEINGAKAAIMDLRGNPGGNMGHCTAMASELVPLNTLLLYDVEHYHDRKRGNVIDTSYEYARDYLRRDGIGINTKWVILMSRGSASCSERFAAAVKYNRPETVVIGQTSYGKGIGQIYKETYMGGLAYITCLQTYYPNGETFHNIGIIPDIETEPGNMEVLRNEAIKAARSFGAAAKPLAMPASSEPFPPERKRPADKWEPAANKRIDMQLFHQGE